MVSTTIMGSKKAAPASQREAGRPRPPRSEDKPETNVPSVARVAAPTCLVGFGYRYMPLMR